MSDENLELEIAQLNKEIAAYEQQIKDVETKIKAVEDGTDLDIKKQLEELDRLQKEAEKYKNAEPQLKQYEEALNADESSEFGDQPDEAMQKAN